MNINRGNPDLWKNDIELSIDYYNSWFMEFAPKAFREMRNKMVVRVEEAFIVTDNFCDISANMLYLHPDVLPILRMSTCPPIARDRLVGLAGVSRSLVANMEDPAGSHVSKRTDILQLYMELGKISKIINKLIDRDLFVWIRERRDPTGPEVHRSATIVADRLCGAMSDPIIRNAQEKRQLDIIQNFLCTKGYLKAQPGTTYENMLAGTYALRMNIPVSVANTNTTVNIPVDVVIMPKTAKPGDFPVLIEAKSAGDYTNVNKRRKEEAVKMQQLRSTYGNKITYTLFLCGYFDSGYLGYEAAEGIDWVWEHRIDDLSKLGL